MLKIIAAPLIGALIGYCTNYIAVKMLFLPRTEKTIFGYRVPFTPGAIPKGKSRLAKAAGSVVAGTLITQDDVSDRLLSDEIESNLMNSVVDALSKDIRDMGDGLLSRDGYDNFESKIIALLTDRVLYEIKNYDIAELIRTDGKEAIMNKVQTSLLAMFLNEQAVDGIIESLIVEIERYIEMNAESIVSPIVVTEVYELGNSSVLGLANKSGYSEDDVRRVIHDVYLRLATSGVQKALKHIDIAGVIEAKINEMSVEELEKIVLEVMKNELNMIVNLGALIGFILGCLNLAL